MAAMTDVLPDDPGTLKAMLLAERACAERLEQIIKELQRHRFGRRAEKLREDQLLLGLEEVEQTVASAEEDAGKANSTARTMRAAKRRLNRGRLPPHLPRIEVTVDIEAQACPCAKARCIALARTSAAAGHRPRPTPGACGAPACQSALDRDPRSAFNNGDSIREKKPYSKVVILTFVQFRSTFLHPRCKPEAADNSDA
jgi:hypothetical protein